MDDIENTEVIDQLGSYSQGTYFDRSTIHTIHTIARKYLARAYLQGSTMDFNQSTVHETMSLIGQ